MTPPSWVGESSLLAVAPLALSALVAVVVFFVADLGKLAPWAQIAYLAISVLGPVIWTALGLGIGASLRRAGVAARA